MSFLISCNILCALDLSKKKKLTYFNTQYIFDCFFEISKKKKIIKPEITSPTPYDL